MRVLVVASRKGGSGKTTLTAHIAVQAERQGAGPVAVIDMDPQGSLADWWNEREADTPLIVRTSSEMLAGEIARLRESGVGLVVIDTPPAITDTTSGVIANSDLVLIPMRPSPHDLRSVSSTVELVADMGKPMVFVLNGATPRARITNEAIAVLAQHGPLAHGIIHQRVDFAVSMIDGRTVMELPASTRATAEIGQLWGYLERRIFGTGRSVFMAPDQTQMVAVREAS